MTDKQFTDALRIKKQILALEELNSMVLDPLKIFKRTDQFNMEDYEDSKFITFNSKKILQIEQEDKKLIMTFVSNRINELKKELGNL